MHSVLQAICAYVEKKDLSMLKIKTAFFYEKTFFELSKYSYFQSVGSKYFLKLITTVFVKESVSRYKILIENTTKRFFHLQKYRPIFPTAFLNLLTFLLLFLLYNNFFKNIVFFSKFFGRFPEKFLSIRTWKMRPLIRHDWSSNKSIGHAKKKFRQRGKRRFIFDGYLLISNDRILYFTYYMMKQLTIFFQYSLKYTTNLNCLLTIKKR